jgi:glycosyltransferase involved in cell wall biosynthesis
MIFLLIGGYAESVVNFRGSLIRALLASGVDVHVAAPGFYSEDGNLIRLQLEKIGVKVHEIPLFRNAINPIADLNTLLALWRLMRFLKPSIVLAYTIKPVIYGSLSAWLARVPHRFCLITGLGYSFQPERHRVLLKLLVQVLYRYALTKVNLIFFQNPDDLGLFKKKGIIGTTTLTQVVNGSGVDLNWFTAKAIPIRPLRFLVIARLLGDKGVREFERAARKLKQKYPEVKFSIVGWMDTNPNSIAEGELTRWISEGNLEFHGRLKDVRPIIEASSVFVLPSYREGMPRSVLEAMAMGRPIITTNAPGCRETVVHGENGFLVPIKDVDALAQAMEIFILDPGLAITMGMRSRELAEEKYDVHKVNSIMLHRMGIT